MTRRHYIIDPKRDMMVVTDASPSGLGAVLVTRKTGNILEGATGSLSAAVAEAPDLVFAQLLRAHAYPLNALKVFCAEVRVVVGTQGRSWEDGRVRKRG